MKTTLRISAGIMLIMALAGCAAQKGGNNTVKSTAEEVLYKQAIQALDERKFIIEATEFYFPGGKPPTKSETNSQIFMDGILTTAAVRRNVEEFNLLEVYPLNGKIY